MDTNQYSTKSYLCKLGLKKDSHYFFETGTFEIQRVWDNELNKQISMTITHT